MAIPRRAPFIGRQADLNASSIPTTRILPDFGVESPVNRGTHRVGPGSGSNFYINATIQPAAGLWQGDKSEGLGAPHHPPRSEPT